VGHWHQRKKTTLCNRKQLRPRGATYPYITGGAHSQSIPISRGITLDQIVTLDLNSMTLTENFQLMLVGFQEGARKAGVECKVNTVEEVSDLLDEDGDILGKMIKAFTEMSLSGNAKPADPDEAKKK
jgi:hypothetical protein